MSDSVLEDLKRFAEQFPPQPASERVVAISLHRVPDLPSAPATGIVLSPMLGDIELRIDPTLLPDQHILHFADGSSERVTANPKGDDDA